MYSLENPSARPSINWSFSLDYNVSVMKPKGNYNDSFWNRDFIPLKVYHEPSTCSAAVVPVFEIFHYWITPRKFK